MIEPAMFFGLGFLAASLLALLMFPLIHGRAVRLTQRRIDASKPRSLAEFQADKDQLRAEFAISTRRLETSLEQLREKTTTQLAELGRKTAAINALKAELKEKAAALAALEKRGTSLQGELGSAEEQLAERAAALAEAERKIAENDAELAKLRKDLEERSVGNDSHRIEIVALKTQIAALKGQVDELQQQVREGEEQLARERGELERARREIEQQRVQLRHLSARNEALEHGLGAHSAEAEALRRHSADIEPQFLQQEVGMREVLQERNRLRAELSALRRTEGGRGGELANTAGPRDGTVEHLRAELAVAEAQIERVREERAKMQRELAALRRERETSAESERQENALLRERITDVAAEVARLTATLEGPSSPIAAIVSTQAEATPAAARDQHDAAPIPFPSGSTLADRIRTLQSHVRRRGAGSGDRT